MLNIVFGLIVAAIIGHQITAVWQMRNWKEQQRILEKKERYSRRIVLIDDLSRITNSRIHESISYLDSLASNNSKQIEKSRDKYKESVVEYNLKFPMLLNKMKAHFSNSQAFDYDNNVPSRFLAIEGELRLLREAHENNVELRYYHGAKIRNITPSLRNFCVRYFSDLYKYTEDEFKYLHETPYLIENINKFSYFQIFRRLFNF